LILKTNRQNQAPMRIDGAVIDRSRILACGELLTIPAALADLDCDGWTGCGVSDFPFPILPFIRL
jgi:hypothetical protein